jgi:Helix-turn-helix domain
MSGYYRSGQAARVWGISPHLVRRLCEAGLIDAERTGGGQWKIPHAEVERIKNEGLPEIPSSIESDDGESDEENSPLGNSLPMPARGGLARSAETAVVGENRRKRLEIDEEPEETRNGFPAPQRVEVRTRPQEHQAQLDKAALARTQQEQIDWHDSWMATALRSVPCEAPPETRLAVRDTVNDALAGLGPQHSWQVIDSLVAAAVGKVLRPWNQERETARAIQTARDTLPWEAKNSFSPSLWQSRAQETAAAAIRRLPADSTLADKLRVGSAAVRQVTSDFEDCELRKRILGAAYLWDVAPGEREEARAAMQKELESLPIGTSVLAMEKARERAIIPFRASKKRKEHVDLALVHIGTYVRGLHQAGETDFESDWAISNFVQRLEQRFRPLLEQELLDEDLTHDELCELLEEWVDEALD